MLARKSNLLEEKLDQEKVGGGLGVGGIQGNLVEAKSRAFPVGMGESSGPLVSPLSASALLLFTRLPFCT